MGTKSTLRSEFREKKFQMKNFLDKKCISTTSYTIFVLLKANSVP